MVLEKEKIAEIIKTYGKNEKDSGSSETQIAIMTARINYLTEHFKVHKKDNHSRRGLLKLVEKRKKLLSFLKSKNMERFKKIKSELNIR